MNKTDFASYAYVTGDSIEDIINSLENDSIKLYKWSLDNQMKANMKKCYILIRRSENYTINIDGNITEKVAVKNSLL